MTMPADNPGNLPTVFLNDKKWPIPELAPRQLREIRSDILEFNRMIGEARKTALAEEGADPEDATGFTELCLSLSNADYERLLMRPVYYGLTRAHPGMNWEEFLDMPMTEMQAVAAWFVVRRQSGLFVFEDKENTGQGEAAAA